MHCIIAVAVLMLPALAASAPDITKDLKDDHKKEIERLVGTWKFISAQAMGQEDLLRGIEMELRITEDKMTPRRDGVVDENQMMKYTIDAGKNPKHIDFKPVEAKGGQPEQILGLYQFKDDELVIVMGVELGDPKSSKRPSSLDDKGDNKAMVIRFTLKRVKP